MAQSNPYVIFTDATADLPARIPPVRNPVAADAVQAGRAGYLYDGSWPDERVPRIL
jgi:hypothetical protein